MVNRHDSELQLLSCPFPNIATKPRAKRAKGSADSETSNVRTRVASNKYNTVQEFLSDIEKASAAVIERNQAQSNGAKADGAPLTEVVNLIAAFKKHMNSLLSQCLVNQPEVKTETSEEDADSSMELRATNVCTREDKIALTLYGNSANPKQLFSSLQKSVKIPLQSKSGPEKLVEVQEELREAGLPNGITTTKVVPFNLAAVAKPSKRTFGEVFAPRETSLKPEPPRKRSHRGISTTWLDRFDATFDIKTFLGERSNYCLAPLPCTQWLNYGGVTSSPSYWDRVEKQHGDSEITHRHGDPALWNGPDSSAFQGVFSSFAPSHDSSGAIVQLASKDMVWWGQKGANRVNTLLSVPNEGEGEEMDTETAQPGNIGELDESTLEEMVASFNAEDFAMNITETGTNGNADAEPKEVKETLRDISDLLDTLSSYQRLRNLNLPSNPPPTGQALDSNEPAGDLEDSNTPSDAEFSVYETLKSSLVTIISNLPPYAVAKLDGHQLSELNISQKIVIETPDYNGTMEKDDFTLSQERAAALMASASAPGRTTTPSNSRPSYPGSHSGYNQRAFSSNTRGVPQNQPGFQVTPQPRQPSAPNTYAHAYGAGRPPSTPSQRPGYPSQYSQGNPQPYTPRPSVTGPFNATPQGRTPYATATANSTPRPPHSNQPLAQGGYVNSAAAATYSRSAAEQAALMDRNKAQLAAHHTRHSPSTPQSQSLDARASQEGSATPGSKQNGTPLLT